MFVLSHVFFDVAAGAGEVERCRRGHCPHDDGDRLLCGFGAVSGLLGLGWRLMEAFVVCSGCGKNRPASPFLSVCRGSPGGGGA